MSRLIIKGLPRNVNEGKLRDVFKEFGAITDVSLKYTKDGVFRRFAFIGFDNDNNAKRALKQVNNTFIDAARVTVEECKPFGDETKPRPWSKYTKGSSAYKRMHPEETEGRAVKSKKSRVENTNGISGLDSDPKFKDFLAVQGIKVNDEVTNNEDDVKELIEAIRNFKGDSKLSLIFRGLPPTIKQNNFKEWLSPIKIKQLTLFRTSAEAFAIVSFNRSPDLRRALQRNDQFIGGFKVHITKFPQKKTSKESEEDEEPVDMDKEKQKTTEAIMDTGRLFVRNLPYVCTEDDLMFLFKKFGEIADLQCIIDKKTGKCKGFAIVTYVFPENALAAYTGLDGSVFKGRMLHILPGDDKPEQKELSIENQHGLSEFQKTKLAKLKTNAGKAHSWNALFLGANAVADTLAEKLQVEKSNLLAGDQDNSAGVRLALAETRLVRETRDFLISQGVKLDAFSRPAVKRSGTIMILKNLPAHIQEEELRRMFERYGVVKRFVFPPEGGVSALLEMENKVDAKKAFTALAYSRLRTQPLYLEWAPCDVFEDSVSKEIKPSTSLENDDEDANEEMAPQMEPKELTKEEKKALRKSKKHRIKEEEKIDEDLTENAEEQQDTQEITKDEAENLDEAEEKEIEGGATVFVKNLNFDTTDEDLYEKFAQLYTVESAVVSKKADPSNSDHMLSMGFGFVQFYTKKDAKDAIKNMQGILLDGHSLELKLSNRELNDKETVQKKAVSNLEQGNCTKILVRNIPFQASKKEVKQLFSTFGEIENLRLPKKVGSDQHRGFAFVDYGSKGEAKRAFDALVHSTHLYGRRLVLEWAKTDETVEELRNKTSQKFSGHKESKHAKKKIMKALEEGMKTRDNDD